MSSPQAMPPHVMLLQMITGKWVSAAIGAAAKFGVADHLESGPKSAKELAALCGASEQPLYRLLRALAGLGIFHELDGERFEQTPQSEPLRTNAKPGLRHMAMMMLEDWHMRAWTELPWCIETGRPGPEKVYGHPMWEEFRLHPETVTIFNRAMTDMSSVDSPQIAAGYDFSKFEHIVDCGGGHGLLLASILQNAPKLRGTLLELPAVIEAARKAAILEPLAARCTFAEGSFLDAVPPADAYIMKHILHDWDDEHATRILSNCRSAMRPGGKVLVVDAVVEEPNVPGFAKLMDLEMLVCPGGLERTQAQWRALFAAAGLKLDRIVTTQAGQTILESTAA